MRDSWKAVFKTSCVLTLFWGLFEDVFCATFAHLDIFEKSIQYYDCIQKYYSSDSNIPLAVDRHYLTIYQKHMRNWYDFISIGNVPKTSWSDLRMWSDWPTHPIFSLTLSLPYFYTLAYLKCDCTGPVHNFTFGSTPHDVWNVHGTDMNVVISQTSSLFGYIIHSVSRN